MIPSLNGRFLRRLFLRSWRTDADIELIMSDNCAEDGTWQFLQTQSDPRLRIFQPPERLDYGRLADFCYQQARGDRLAWISQA
jgi:hypothetical protein